MAIMAKASGESTFTPVSEGLHPAVCWAVVDLGIQQKGGMYPGEAHEVYLGFEVLDQSIDYEKDGKKQTGPMRIGITVTNSLGEKAKLRKFLNKWRGREFTEDELAGFDLETVAGAPCQLLVTHAQKGGKTYANIENVLAWPKGTPRPDKPEVLTYSLETPATGFDKLPKWLQEKVEKRLASNWKEFNALADVKRHEEPAKAAADDFDDDVPF